MSGSVAKTSRGSTTPKHEPKVVRTCGEIFSDGSIIELVSPANACRLQLLLWHKQQQKIAPQIEYHGRLYQVPEAQETLLAAMRFPSDAVDYGTAQKLFSGVCDLFARYIGIAPPEAALLTAWSCSTWFADCFSSPPTLIISGPDTGHAIALLWVLACLCRRSLVLADITRGGLLGVMSLQPTLLVNQPGQLPKVWNLYSASNFHGVYVPGSQGRVFNLAGSRAFFVGMDGNIFSDGAIHVALSPAHPMLPTLNAELQVEIAKRFQPRLLMYRLRNLRKVRESHATVCRLKFPNTEAAQNLSACIQEEPEIAQVMAPVLQRQDHDAQVQRGCDVSRVILEVIWTPLHERKEIAASRITELTNALLRCRGETLEYSTAEIGWKLRNLGLYRHRNGSGMVLRPSRDISVVVHRLAARLGLDLSPVAGCVDCVQTEVIVAE
jgi:hypothetical protein